MGRNTGPVGGSSPASYHVANDHFAEAAKAHRAGHTAGDAVVVRRGVKDLGSASVGAAHARAAEPTLGGGYTTVGGDGGGLLTARESAPLCLQSTGANREFPAAQSRTRTWAWESHRDENHHP